MQHAFVPVIFLGVAALAIADATKSGTYILGPHYTVDPVLIDADTHTPQGRFYDFALPLKGSKYYGRYENTTWIDETWVWQTF